MADEIRQQLTFDASQAISSLDNLSKSLLSTKDSLRAFGRQVTSFNKRSGAAIKTMGDLATAASNLRGSLQGGVIPQQATAGVQQATGLVDQFGNSLSSQADNASKVTASNAKAAKSVANTGKAASKAKPQITGLTVSFSTLAKIITTQLTVRAFSGLIRGLQEATSSAIDFQLGIAEIQSITDNAFSSFDRAAEAVRGISDAFNQPLGEVQEGLYQVISNQIQGASNQITVLESASNLAKVGVADLSSTVGLLTGTINAFELESANATQIAGVFFETVRLGRTRIQELANSFGTVAPLAAEAGLEFEELAAAFASVTINGVDTAKAATQLRGIINAFIKPTKEMAAVLEAAGFSSGEMAIEVLGLGGALALLQDATGGSTTELAKLIPRVRGLSGALVLARNNGDTLNKTVEQLRATASDLLTEKLELRLETNAEQVQADLNRIKNALTVDLGQGILATIKGFLDLTNGADLLVGTIKILTPALITLGGAAILAAVGLGAYTLAAKSASLANVGLATTSKFARRGLLSLGISRQLTRSLLGFARGVTPVTIGFAIGAAIGVGLNDAIVASAKKSAKEASDELKRTLIEGDIGQNLQAVRDDARERINLIKKVVKEQVASLNEVKRLERQRTNVFLSSNAAILSDTQNLFSILKSANNKLLKDLQKERDTSARLEESSLDRQANLRATIEDRAFKTSISFFNDRQKLFALEERGTQLAATANKALASARTEADVQTATDQLQRAEGFLQESDAIAQASNSLRDQNRIFQTRQRISNKTLRSEQTLSRIQAKLKDDAAKALAIEEKRVATLNREVQEANKAIKAVESAKTAEEKLFAIRKARAEISDITTELAFGKGTVDFAQLVSFQNFQSSLVSEVKNSGLDTSVGKLLEAVELTNLIVKFEQGTAAAVLKGVQDAEAAAAEAGFELNVNLNLDTSSLSQLQSTIDQLIKASGAEQEGISAIVTQEDALAQRRIAGQAAVTEAITFSKNAALLFTQALARAGRTGTESFKNTEAALILIKNRTQALAEDFADLTPAQAATELVRLSAALRTVQTRAGQTDIAANISTIQAINLVLTRLSEANEANTATSEESANNVKNTLSTIPRFGAQLVTQMKQVESISANVARNLNTQVTVGPAPTATAATGKFFPKFLADGGFASQGTDTIPAMLSPGEFVVNARSTRRFFSQLQAINSGVKPIFRQDGGPVINIGDINVAEGTSKEAAATGRTITRILKREMRRGLT